jgi:hypothetical protein
LLLLAWLMLLQLLLLLVVELLLLLLAELLLLLLAEELLLLLLSLQLLPLLSFSPPRLPSCIFAVLAYEGAGCTTLAREACCRRSRCAHYLCMFQKTNLARAPVATHSWYSTKTRRAAQAKVGSSGTVAVDSPMLLCYISLLNHQAWRRPSHTAASACPYAQLRFDSTTDGGTVLPKA